MRKYALKMYKGSLTYIAEKGHPFIHSGSDFAKKFSNKRIARIALQKIGKEDGIDAIRIRQGKIYIERKA